MTNNSIEDILARAEQTKLIMRTLIGRPSMGIRDLVTMSIAHSTQRLAAQMQARNQPQPQPQPPQPEQGNPAADQQPQNPQTNPSPRPRILSQVRERFMPQRPQQAPPQPTQDDIDEAEKQKKQEEARQKEHERLLRSRDFSVSVGDSRSG